MCSSKRRAEEKEKLSEPEQRGEKPETERPRGG